MNPFGPVRLLTLVALLVAAFQVDPLSARMQETDGSILIRNVSVIDGTGAEVRSGLDVTVRDGLIESIQPTRDGTEFDGRVIEGSGMFLIPGLVDSHVHLSGAPNRADAAEQLEWAAEGGVTSVRDMAGDARELAGLKQALLSGQISGPSLYYSVLMAGPPFMSDPRLSAATVGYEQGDSPYMVPLTSSTDIARVVAMAKGTGATGIKLYAALKVDLVRSVTEEAHREGLQVWGHSAIFPAKPVEIIETGIDGISHAPYVIWEADPPTPDFTLRAQGDFDRISADGPEMDRVINSMLAHRTLMDPTLFVFDRFGASEGVARKRLTWAAAFTKRANEAGVIIAAGTDGLGQPLAGALPNVHTELELLVDLADLTPLQAITAGTFNGAIAIGIEDATGSIEVGKVADLVLLGADPSVDIRNTRVIEHVVLRGRVIR